MLPSSLPRSEARGYRRSAVNDDTLLELLRETTAAIRSALDGFDDWSLSGTREGQYHADVAADTAALAVLDPAGVGVLSEESGLRRIEGDVVVVIDPIDGSTNASRGVPWFAASLCAVDGDGPRVALVENLPTGDKFEAVRGGGATLNGRPIAPTGCRDVAEAFLGLAGYPPDYFGWSQYRALGAAALDLCAVASGVLDGYVDCSVDSHGVWDYAAALLVCREAGASVVDAFDRDLVILSHEDRRTPIAAATPALLEALVDARRSIDEGISTRDAHT
jgi:fructose-1,6-bisphosphatase/inositol monophosphatase family enzyme